MADANQGNAPVVPANQAIIDQLAALNAQLQQLQRENATLANDIQVLQQANQGGGAPGGQANQANQGGVAPGGQANAPGAPAAPTFALTPATTNLTGLIDYSSKLGQSIYKQGCAKLTDDDGFPMTPATTVSFVKAFENRCNIMGWNAGAQNVTKFTNQSNVVIDIVKNYGQIAEEDLKIGCEAFCKAGGARFQSRASQNNHMMAQCLLNSLTSDAKTRLEVFQTQFTYDEIAYGPLIYKKIMQLATIDSVATTETLRANLTNLPIYAASVNGDIDLINAYFDQNYTQILARGSTVDDPIAKLFDAYLVVPDYTFKTYMAKKQDAYHDGDLGPDFTHEKLMAQATAKFTNQSNVVVDIVKNYGQIAEEDLKVGCEAFCKAGGARFQSRASQNNHMMAQCLMNSLTSDAKTRLEVFQTQYTYDEVAYGPLIYKKIMQLATIDSVATTETLRANLTNMPIYAASVNGDINLINVYFDQNYADPSKGVHRRRPHRQAF